ncbi:winged helix-turn-helix domain-containing protein [Ectopseudomonas mendocina]|uniref:Winged helix-turn-helix domain-containing protein n=1 Tax=Ectopseudomonas mendocina TaxID=300 RepID=A0ABZ2RHY5_ECTME
MSFPDRLNTSLAPPPADPATSSFLTIKTGRSDCYALFSPSLFQLTLVQGEHTEKIDLGFSGTRLLERLLQVPGEVVSRDELMSYAWADRVVGQGSLNQQIYTLRQVLGDEKNREIIQTLPRRGYQINPGYLAASANDSDEQPAQAIAPSQPQHHGRRLNRKRISAMLAGVLAAGSGLFALLSSASQPGATYSDQVTLGMADMHYIEQSPQRLEQLMSDTQALSTRLSTLNTQPITLTLTQRQGYYQLVCQRSQGQARTLMFHINQFNLLKDAQLLRCLS